MTAIRPYLANASPRFRFLVGSAVALFITIVAEALLGLVIGLPGTSLVSLVAGGAAGLVVGNAVVYRILRPSASAILDRPVVAVAESVGLPGEASHPAAAAPGRFDAIAAKALVVTGELGHYKEVSGILRDQMKNVTVETEGRRAISSPA
jgi:hypothetical protein